MRDVFIGVALTAIVTLPIAVLGATAPILRADLALTESAYGVVVGLFFLTGAAASVPAGRAANSIGLRRLLLGSCAITAAALIGVTAAVDSWWPLVGWLAAAGIANAAGQVAANRWLVRHRPANRQGVAFGAKQAAVPLAALSAGLLVPLVVVPYGWRAAFIAAAAASLVGFALLSRASRHGRSASTGRGEHGSKMAFNRPVVLLAVIGVLGASGGTCLAPFLVDYATTRGVPVDAAGLLLASGSFAGVIARLLAGLVADQLSVNPVKLIGALMGGGSAGVALLAVGASGALWLPAVVLAFAGAWGWAGLLPFALARTAPQSFSNGIGLVVMGQLFGAVLGPVVFGFVVEYGGYRLAWLVVVAFVAGASLLTVAMLRVSRGSMATMSSGGNAY